MLLSGTPMINYPYEIAYVINLIKGYEIVYSINVKDSDIDYGSQNHPKNFP